MADEPIRGVADQLSDAEGALTAFARGPAQRAASEVAEAFERAGARISRTLASAGASGELSFKRLAKTVLEEMAKIALDRLIGAKTQTPFFGARAGGGPVNAGGAYLVGERGPEWFTPRAGGVVSPAQASGAVTVHFHLGAGADADSIARNKGQIAAEIARAAAYGRRNL